MDYEEAVNYVYSLTNYEKRLNKVSYAEKKFYLERMNYLLEVMGNPHKKLKGFHIAGTKGKGSTSAMIFSVLKEAGYKVGLYTSPHLQSLRERISTQDGWISQKEFVELLEMAKPYIQKTKEHPIYGSPTFFEVLTSLAFLYFYNKKLDYVVIEVGLGGRLDATNTITPLISVITPISFDHTHILGNTLYQIATEKAGIIKEGIPLVSSPQDPEAWEAIKKIAVEKNAPYVKVDDAYKWNRIDSNLSGQRFRLEGNGTRKEIFIPLLGQHQIINAVTAYAALRMSNLNLNLSAIKQGFSKVEWKGRFEIIQEKPLIVIDGAHNVSSAIALKETLQDYVNFKHLFLICGMMKDKDAQGFISTLDPLVFSFHFVPLPSPRTRSPKELAEMVNKDKPTYIYETSEEAFKDVIKRASPTDLILITGSLYLVGEARDYFYGKID
ncbi:MAG TPA: folylpolyglutamate synthase/dihydrofolate synthase family protein [Dictyoglomaceae bacterium]|nr:folylpolyglutamate synthase/dihydrofolate synthase family protein [Dictyoglomaceae bacterium]HOL38991.1 folylpolyglutamate synthase/dihydrofolate synthase family protein [Dictyoglomaceae bacterium]HOP94330.1 folylpolyglutamate synthase/dihydrofolate synthase family protein [Dictyoglomaceae bacterium]HPP15833.1 folylpolyglutamate synthase/dihydrofolate synthase family protein [Dictyoglomaceae bacterium]HPU42822.1 folylpolyglutamate synthase/dihydrofolate synthase family protein [Dictyoglomace